MDVLERKPPNLKLNDQFLKYLKFKKQKIVIKGTSSLKSQYYYSDYDLYSKIKRHYKHRTIANELNRILNQNINDMYFIENKIQYMNGEKLKNINFKSTMFKKPVSFVKIDYIVRIDNIFRELSIIYDFKNEDIDVESKKQDLQNDINDLIKEGKYYKTLKRLFSIYKIEKNKKGLLTLTRFFNSNYGKIYALNSNLIAIQLLLKNYDDEMTKRKVMINLKDIHIDPTTNIQHIINSNDQILNNKAKIIYQGLV